MPGLITRIGTWIDEKWESSATLSHVKALEERMVALDEQTFSYFEEKLKADGVIVANALLAHQKEILAMQAVIEKLQSTKELADIKTRVEKIELYTGFTRKPDALAGALQKSPFQM